MTHEQNYLLASWQGLLQMLVNLIGKGYYYVHLTELPINKKPKWGVVDQKMMDKYKTNKSKWQRQRAKAKGVANFYFMRWEHLMFVLHTSGTIPDDITLDDKFCDIRETPFHVSISELVTFRLHLIQNQVTVHLSSDTYRGFKATLYNVAKLKSVKLIKETFNQLNGFPAYKGIYEQKKQLAQYVVNQAIKHQIKITRNNKARNLSIRDLRLTSTKKTVPNFLPTVADTTKKG